MYRHASTHTHTHTHTHTCMYACIHAWMQNIQEAVDIPVVVIYKSTMQQLLSQMRGGGRLRVALQPVLQHLPLIHELAPTSPTPHAALGARDPGTPPRPSPCTPTRRYSPSPVVCSRWPGGGALHNHTARRRLLALPPAVAAGCAHWERREGVRGAGAEEPATTRSLEEADIGPRGGEEVMLVGAFCRAGALGQLETLSLCECKWVNDHVLCSLLAAVVASAGCRLKLRQVDLSWTSISGSTPLLCPLSFLPSSLPLSLHLIPPSRTPVDVPCAALALPASVFVVCVWMVG